MSSTPFCPLFFLLIALSIADDSTFRLADKIAEDEDFFSLWKDLILLQEKQRGEVNDSVLSSVADLLKPCGRVSTRPERVDNLRPEDIDIYVDAGHLSTFCSHHVTPLTAGELDSCGHDASQAKLLTIDKILAYHNPNVTTIREEFREGDTLTEQLKRISSRIQKIPNYEDKWKLILILPNIQDGEASETGQAAVEVLTAVEELEKALPRRTFIVIVRNSGKGIWKDASHAHEACRIILKRWQQYSHFNMDTVWDQVDLIVRKNFQSPNFAVEMLPLLNEASLAQTPNGMDLSVLGYDCSHLSERGLSLFHEIIWNSLLTRTSSRTHEFRPVHSTLLCPDPRCPFLRTASNSAVCIWSPVQEDTESLIPPLIAFAVLIIAAFLCLFLLLFLCLRPKKEFKKQKAFGSNLSSIRFIDEDAA